MNGHRVVLETVIYGVILDFSLTLLPSLVGATLLEPGMHEFLFLTDLFAEVYPVKGCNGDIRLNFISALDWYFGLEQNFK